MSVSSLACGLNGIPLAFNSSMAQLIRSGSDQEVLELLLGNLRREL